MRAVPGRLRRKYKEFVSLNHHLLYSNPTLQLSLTRQNDDQCEGNLVCKDRDENDPIDGCSGGRSDNSRMYIVHSTDGPTDCLSILTPMFSRPSLCVYVSHLRI